MGGAATAGATSTGIGTTTASATAHGGTGTTLAGSANATATANGGMQYNAASATANGSSGNATAIVNSTTTGLFAGISGQSTAPVGGGNSFLPKWRQRLANPLLSSRDPRCKPAYLESDRRWPAPSTRPGLFDSNVKSAFDGRRQRPGNGERQSV